ncbi:MFS transporter [Sinorhizobium sp. RAC02]|uniref:MFS transporter n=1 Tax=Sinorhizobium sp. RAC02 TaxID=1842534 RepID=UPI00083D16FE|nr:MFS transporter [Sinorhizobium sp. RAC02]AOF92244.1 putative membrane protein [Sinorhizobium sp. RAC02]
MDKMAPTSHEVEWTLADFLSTYRYWAVFLSSLFLAIAGGGFGAMLPLILQSNGSSTQAIGIFYFASTVGWIVGAFLAFVVASRNGRPALIVPLVFCAVFAAGLVSAPALWGSPMFLFAFGLVLGTVRAVYPLAIAIFLAGGRPGKIDFGCALALMSTTILASGFAPIGASLLYALDQGGLPLVLGFLACLTLAVILLLPAGQLAFDEPPVARHKPLAPRRRPPLLVAIILLFPPILILVTVLGVYLSQASGFDVTYSPVMLLVSILVLGICIAAFIYLSYWVYRIHGELAGARPSRRLLTPLAAMFIAILVPLGLPILIMTLGDLLNDRARERGEGRLVSIAWLAVWSLILPPVAIAMIQNAANTSYGMGPDMA